MVSLEGEVRFSYALQNGLFSWSIMMWLIPKKFICSIEKSMSAIMKPLRCSVPILPVCRINVEMVTGMIVHASNYGYRSYTLNEAFRDRRESLMYLTW